jgi:hypothetical protein
MVRRARLPAFTWSGNGCEFTSAEWKIPHGERGWRSGVVPVRLAPFRLALLAQGGTLAQGRLRREARGGGAERCPFEWMADIAVDGVSARCSEKTPIPPGDGSAWPVPDAGEQRCQANKGARNRFGPKRGREGRESILRPSRKAGPGPSPPVWDEGFDCAFKTASRFLPPRIRPHPC